MLSTAQDFNYSNPKVAQDSIVPTANVKSQIMNIKGTSHPAKGENK